jgi:hypothetical protein
LKVCPLDFVALTCCPAVSEPDLRVENLDQERAPKMIQWECTERDYNGNAICSNCGVSKLIDGCQALAGCDISIPVSEWQMVTCSLDAEGSVDRTQMELYWPWSQDF